MTAPAPLDFPIDPEGWLAFVTERPATAVALVADIDARLASAGAEVDAAARLALWNDADLALRQATSEVYLLSESHPDAAVREAAEEQVQRLEALSAGRLLDRDLFAALSAVDSAEASAGLDHDERRLLTEAIRDFRRGGVDLDDAARERVRELTDRDTELSLEFSRNIRDGRREIRVAPDALAGLPQDFINEHPPGEDGLVVLTTDYPDLMPVREYATDRATRTALVAAYNELAWPANDAVLAELLRVRAERAHLLGYGSWADYETETRMIGRVTRSGGAAIADFLGRLDEASGPAADAEYPLLLERLRQDDPEATEVTVADFFYLLSALRRERHDVDAQLVRSYFTFERVLPGLLATTGRLFDVTYVPVDVATWHPDVHSYDVVRGGEPLGRIHLDLHPREGKYTHAACFGLAPGITGRVLPESSLLCNFARGFMTHDEVVTFFHEFGHLVHDILGGDQRIARFSGVATEWDFVEAPSQLLEEWAWDAEVLASFTAGPDGEPIPAELVEKMAVADGFGRALEVRRQLGHANVSYHLHVDLPDDLQAATEHWYTVTSPVAPLRGLHPYAGFGHLTGYGACYYTYQWSLVIARDLLSAFDGDLLDAAVATRYRREILEPGGSRDAADLVEGFLGRAYGFDAYREWLAG
ncbi:MAG: peptidase M3 [Microbacterium sp. SCN 70-27]|uniref:M3 family metallopeptidase n=1 Tax=unclassified Microbacterium TaxID=2609290 RepID=UPI000868FE5D|nr:MULTISPECIES: M3 family metallopeptidase [unclassified Microbacterium]MBN9225665.1 Zn-dependent oligopeptidase [Microbacterium sp.]ODT29168.1 MAG: peptidase M3 [Microbacterium sp. SCN 70-27]